MGHTHALILYKITAMQYLFSHLCNNTSLRYHQCELPKAGFMVRLGHFFVNKTVMWCARLSGDFAPSLKVNAKLQGESPLNQILKNSLKYLNVLIYYILLTNYYQHNLFSNCNPFQVMVRKI